MGAGCEEGISFREVLSKESESRYVDHGSGILGLVGSLRCEKQFAVGRAQIVRILNRPTDEDPGTQRRISSRGIPATGRRWRASTRRRWSGPALHLPVRLLCALVPAQPKLADFSKDP